MTKAIITLALVLGLCLQVFSQYCYYYYEGQDFKVNGSLQKIETMAAFADSSLWFGLYTSSAGLASNGLVRIKDNQWQNWNTSNCSIPDNHINGIAFDNAGKVWVATDKGLFSFIAKDNLNQAIFNTTSGLPENKVTAIAVDKNDTIWMGFSSGKVYKLKGTTITQELEYTSQAVNALFFDAGGNLWVGLSATVAGKYGVVKFDKKNAVTYLENESGQSFSQGRNGTVYFNSLVAAYSFQPGTAELKKLASVSGYKLTVDKLDRVWVNSNDTVFCIEGDIIRSFSTMNSGFFPAGSTVPSKSPVATDALGNIWFGYLKSGAALGKLVIGQSATNLIKKPEITFCSGDSTKIEAESGYTSYYWNTAEKTNAIYSKTDSHYNVAALDSSSNCYYYDSVHTFLQKPYENEKICLVTVDNESGKNLVVWNRTKNKGTVLYRIFKETEQAGQYNLLAEQSFNQLSVYTDLSAIPETRSERYKIASVDSCNNESEQSAAHKTMHLTINVGLEGKFNLIWENYEGVDFKSYIVYRGTAQDNLEPIQTIPSNITTYTDDPADGTYYYQVAMVLEDACSPALFLKAGAGPYSEAISNMEKRIKYINPDYISCIQSGIKVFPNPVRGKLIITDNNNLTSIESVEFYLPDGRLINISRTDDEISKIHVVDLSNLMPGNYLMRIKGKGLNLLKVIVKQ